MGLFGPYTYKSKDKSKKEKWYLHVTKSNNVNLYFFSKDPIRSLNGIPRGYEVFENKRTGIPMLRKKIGEKKVKKDKSK